MTLMEKRIGNKENPLSIDELKEDLNLRYERLSSKSESTRNDDYGEEKALFVTQFSSVCNAIQERTRINRKAIKVDQEMGLQDLLRM